MEFLKKIDLKDPKHIVGLLLVGYLIYYLYTEHFTKDDDVDNAILESKAVNTNSGQPIQQTTTSGKTINFKELLTKNGKSGNCTGLNIIKKKSIISTHRRPGGWNLDGHNKAVDICRKQNLCKGVDVQEFPKKGKIPHHTKWHMLHKIPKGPSSYKKHHWCFIKE